MHIVTMVITTTGHSRSGVVHVIERTLNVMRDTLRMTIIIMSVDLILPVA